MAQNNNASNPNPNSNINPNQKYEFSIGSFNVWCPYWNGSESQFPQKWKKRHNNILKMLYNDDNSNNSNNNIQNDNKSNINDDNKNNNKDIDIDPNNDISKQLSGLNCDIYCLQEIWCDRDPFVRLYANYFKTCGYSLHYLTRTSKHKPDGIAMLIKDSSFKLLNKIEHKYSISNRIAIYIELLHISSGINIIIGNTHLTFPTEYYDTYIRKTQCKEFIDELEKNTKHNSSLMILAGDFNCEIDQNEALQCINKGYISSFHAINSNINGNVVSHFNHSKQSVFVDHIFYKLNKKVNKDKEFIVTPIDSYLYPKHIPVNQWPSNNEWDLSDHRPIVTTFQVQKPC